MSDTDSLDALLEDLERRLLACRHPEGCWRGRLASSALANALACIALRDAPGAGNAAAAQRGIAWLCEHRNADGGWGDTPNSPSNLSTTLLCRAALRHCGDRSEPHVVQAEHASAAWTTTVCGAAEGSALAPHIRDIYGRDRTFAAPILAVCAHTGLLGEGGWRVVPPLPYALALAPAPLYRFLRLNVVSYALPALIAVGLMIDCGRSESRRGALRSALRRWAAPRLLRKLTAMQPSSGGFLEAIPLTAFVAVGLTASGHDSSEAVSACTEFLLAGQREDGSWPIDTDLATWLTTETVKALPAADEAGADTRAVTVAWLLKQQFAGPHPFTRAAPGGWGWTDHPGAVPDADDTSGVLLALHRLAPEAPEVQSAAEQGVEWLLNLQNRDGGVPTFCRGWGRLPFDRSCPDITAHAAAAVAQWLPRLSTLAQERAVRFLRRCLAHLCKTQAPDGSWVPLWFGNQSARNQENPVFGTARALFALANPAAQAHLRTPHARASTDAALDFLQAARHPDGGWGGGCDTASASVEETAVATAALLAWGWADAAAPGLAWLHNAWTASEPAPAENPLPNGTTNAVSGVPFTAEPAPIGLYFQSLWYSESLYPLIFSVQALRQEHKSPTSGYSNA